nr:ribonuclease H-like domain-containing protein [Tanacetum cinerariifolium]
LSPSKPAQNLSHTNRPTATIIEDWVSDSEDESETKAPQIVSSFVESFEQVKNPRHSIQLVETSIPAATPKPTSPKSNRSGKKKRIENIAFCAPMVSAAQGMQGKWGNPQYALTDKEVINSGCSQHMTENMSYLSDFQELNGGYVAFGGNPKGGKISGKGKIKTGKLDFDDVYFVKELNFNLLNVSQMCDKKNSVFFTDTECLVLSPDFKLPDESQALLRVPRENNMVLVSKPHNKIPYELLHGRTPSISFMRPFGCLTTILKTLDSLGKFEGKVDEGFLVGYSNYDGDAAFDGKEHDFDAKKPESKVILSPSSSAQSRKQDGKTKKEAKGKSPVESFIGYRDLQLEDITYSDDENDVSAEADQQMPSYDSIVRAFASLGHDLGTIEDKILVPKPPKNCTRCTRCGYLVDGPNCHGCALLRQELEENLVTHSPDFQNTFEPSNASTNVVNAPREPYVVKQDNGCFVDKIILDLDRAPDSPDQFHCFHCKDVKGWGSLISETSSQSPLNINHCCYECGDPLDGIFCKQYTCKSCGKDAHIGYNCPSKVLVISNSKPCNNQTIDELPQALPSFHPTFHSEAESPFTLDSTPTYVNESPNVFNPPPQPPVYPCEFCKSDAYYGHYCTPQAPFLYPKPCYNQDFNFPQDFQDVLQQYPCCDDCRVAQKKLEEKQIEEEQAAKAQTWKLPVCYDDDDDEESSDSLNDNIISRVPSFSAITPDEPVLSIEEPDNSLSMGDEHLDTILVTKSDEFIKSGVKNLIPIPIESEGIPEHICDVLSHDNSSPLDVSKDTIKDLSESNEEFSSTDDDSFSLDNIDYVEASPLDSKLVSSKVMEIVIPEVGRIKASNDNPIPFYDPIIPGTPSNLTPSGESDFFSEGDMLLFEAILNDDHSSDLKTKSSSTSLNSLLEETKNFNNSLPEFTTFLKVLFDAECESDSSDDQSSSDEDVLEKIISKPLSKEEIIPMEFLRTHDSSLLISSMFDSLLDEFAGELTLLKSISSGINETDCDFEEDIRLIEKLLYDNSSPRPPEEFVSANSDAASESFSPSPILVKDSDSLMEEIDLFYTSDYPMPPGIVDKDYDSERDILIPKDLPSNNSLSFAEKESFHFDIPLFSRPLAKPPDGDTRILNIKMMGDVFDQKAFMHKLMITLASHQEKSLDILSHRYGTVKKFNTHHSHLNKCPMLFHGQKILLDVLLFHFYPP